ncbi:MAG TPA: 50S ribosomal protein L3 N(5)-glutamine methyltransferase [Burkholderiaceae bacterium]|nr:50S ribosomal protein L3 N(5)-glutamine methyltransferase [Burkholderiaceae bacterium]
MNTTRSEPTSWAHNLTVKEAIEAGEKLLTKANVSFGHGTLTAFDEAAWLVLWQLGLPLDTELSAIDFSPELTATQPVSLADAHKLAALFETRITTRKPAAYLTQEAWLQGVPFYIDERAIVPRSHIAQLLADGSFDAWLGPHTQQILDMCTGNGSLAVLAAMTYPETRVTGADLSSDALAVAHINVAKHHLENRITFIESNCWQSLHGQVFDLILCNPPYVNSQSMKVLPAEYLAEPDLALAGGLDGMDFIRSFFAGASKHMSEHAIIVLEIGNERAYFEMAFPDLAVEWLETAAGWDQVLLVTKSALQNHLNQ